MLQRNELVAVSQRSCGIVDGAGPDDDEEALVGIGACYDCDGLIAAGEDGLFRGGGLGDFVLEEIGCDERVVTAD